MTRRLVLAIAAVLVGAGVAAAVIATRHGDGGRPRAASAEGPNAVPVENRIRLSRAESLRLVDWARRFRVCMAGRGVALAEPVAHPREIDLALERPAAAGALAGKVVACGDRLGEPPRDSSLQVRPGKLVLYLPRQCLLDAKVAKAETTS